MKPDISPTVGVAIDSIRDKILAGIYGPGSVLPSESALADDLSISRGTVRRAIEALVTAGELNRRPFSRPTVAERSAGPQKSDGLEVKVWVGHPLSDDTSLQFLRGISIALMGTNYRMVVREPRRFYADFVKIEEREFLMTVLATEDAVGMIIQRDAFAQNEDIYFQILESGKHIVFVDLAPPEGVQADHVTTANLASARRCVSHLLDLGHTRICFLTDTDVPDSLKERERGYWRAMESAGVASFGSRIVADDYEPVHPPLRMPIGGVYSRGLANSAHYSEKAQRVVRQLLTMNPIPTALFVSCDVLAIWVCAYLEGAGVHIPEEMSVVGFDWLGRWADPGNDLLTTAGQNFEGFGTFAAELLLDRISDGYSGPPRRVLLPAPLVVKSSTAPVSSFLISGQV